MKDLTDSQSAMNIMGLRGQVEAALTRWASGERVYADDRGRACFLKRLDPPPPEIWEIRVTEPRVHARLFCRFAEQDTLIMIRLRTRGVLGNKKRGRQAAKADDEWRLTMTECEADWVKLFGSFSPFTGQTIHDYVSENCDDFPI